MQIPILSGISVKAEFRTDYPVNLIPVPKQTGISEGYVRPAHGIVSNGVGVDRGGIEWKGVLYRVLGNELHRVNEDGTTVSIGPVSAGGRVSFDYGFDYLSVAAGGFLYLYNGIALRAVTDPDIGNVLDAIWIDGYYMTTDGKFLVVTELNDPFQVNPLKYGSSEADPDQVVALKRFRAEVYAINRHTIEVFTNTGGAGFPFERIRGAQIQKGAIGTHAACVFQDAIAFLGSGHNEAISLYIGGNGGAVSIATREIDQVIGTYTEAELSGAVLETMTEDKHAFLILRLPRDTLVYDASASQAAQSPVWFRLASSWTRDGAWDAGNLVWAYNRWNVGRVTQSGLGYLTKDTGHHWGQPVGWSVTTPVIYGEGRGAIVHELEAVAVPGNVTFGANPQIGMQYSTDGVEWSQIRWIEAGRTGQRNKRLSWRGCGKMHHWRIQRIIGTSDAPLSIARLEARLEPLAF